MGLPETSPEDEAAGKIQRAWRRSRAAIDLLEKGKHTIGNILHKKFHPFCDVIRPLLRKASKHPVRHEILGKLIDSVIEYREAYNDLCYIPLILNAPGHGKMPQYWLVPKSNLWEGCEPFGRLYLTEKAQKQYKLNSLDAPRTIEEAHALVKGLHALTDILALSNPKGGCFARANLIIDLLELAGVPRSCMGKQFLYVPNELAYGPMEDWNYHVAVLVRLQDGTKCIIDPTVHADCALTIDDWIGLLTLTPSEDNPLPLENSGLIVPEENEPIEFHFDPDKCLTFTSVMSTELEFDDEGDPKGPYILSKVYPAEDKVSLSVLADYRSRIEKTWLEDTFFDID